MSNEKPEIQYDYVGMVQACLDSGKLNEENTQSLVEHALSVQNQEQKLSPEDYFYYTIASAWLFRARGWPTEITPDGVIAKIPESGPFHIPRGGFDRLMDTWIEIDEEVMTEIRGQEGVKFWPLYEYRLWRMKNYNPGAAD